MLDKCFPELDSPCGWEGPILPPSAKLEHASIQILNIYYDRAQNIFNEKSLISESLATGNRHQTFESVFSDSQLWVGSA